MSVTYRDLPQDIDPIAFLFGDLKFTVPISRFTPELTARYYERALQTVDTKSLRSKSDHVPYGLESLSSLLRYEPGHYGTKWLRLTAASEVIAAALPMNTPLQQQYLELFGFCLPKWHNIPLVPFKDPRFGFCKQVMGEIESDALLYGKKELLYFVAARWKPEQDYFGGGEEPRFCEQGTYVFHLSHLSVEVTNWQDSRVLKRIEEGRWSDIQQFNAKIQGVTHCSAEVLEARARGVRRVSELFEYREMPIQTDR